MWLLKPDDTHGLALASLSQVVLSWNKIRGKGAAALLSGIGVNASLRDFDVSWNAIGSVPDHGVAVSEYWLHIGPPVVSTLSHLHPHRR